MTTLKELEKKFEGLTPETTDDFVWSIRSALSSRSVPTLQMLGFMNKVTTPIVIRVQACCDSVPPAGQVSETELLMNSKILAAHILLLHQTHSYKELSEKILTLLQWSACLGGVKDDVTRAAISCLSRQCTDPGFTWDTIRNAMSIGFIIYHIVTKGRFGGAALPSITYDGRGSLALEDGVLHVSSCLGWRAGAQSWESCGGQVMVHTRNSRDEKLKASHLDNAALVAEFARNFTASQTSPVAKSGSLAREAKVGGNVTVMCGDFVESEDGAAVLHVHPLYSSLERKGVVKNEELLKGVWVEDLIPYMYEGDCIRDAVLVDDHGEPEFSIQKCYIDFARKAAEEDLRNNTFFEAVAIRVNSDIQRINWMTAGGYGAISLVMDGVKPGDKAVLTVKNIQNNGFYINVESPKYGYDHIDRHFDDEQVLTGFLTTEAEVYREVSEAAEKTPEEKAVKMGVFRSLARILFHSTAADSIERYRQVLSSLFLSTCIEDGAGIAMAEAEAYYLGRVLAFAQGSGMSVKDVPPSLDEDRKAVLECLSLFWEGTLREISPYLCSEGTAGAIASLLSARVVSGQFSDEVKADGDAVRKRICTILGVGDSFVHSHRRATGKYGQNENANLEFKSSYVFSNHDGQPDLIRQGRDQVFEAVCGFLNSDGGTVYVGVNDDGDPILSETSGIKGDLAWFRANFATVLPKRMRQLGHGIPNPDTIEHYALFLSQEKQIYFKGSVLDKILIEPTADADAIRITVRPSRYEIAYLYEDETHSKGIAYRRDAGSTLPMTDKQKEERLMDQKHVNKEVQFAVILQQACDQQRKVTLKGYYSGNSGEVGDRHVVPINLFYNDENILCYDLDSHCEKQFRLARITSIDTDVPNPEYPNCFVPKEADVFRWIGDESYHIKVRMEVGAYNYLLEEYSAAKDLPEDELYREESGKWILDTHLQGLGAMRRFYLGLADKMEILETEDSGRLRACIDDFVRENLKSNH